jgi:hypothetical protein
VARTDVHRCTNEQTKGPEPEAPSSELSSEKSLPEPNPGGDRSTHPVEV